MPLSELPVMKALLATLALESGKETRKKPTGAQKQ